LDRGADTWALADVSFEVAAGECFGISGPNGAGKSTLLSLIAGILEPTSGRVETFGRTNTLLSLGHGLQPELSVLDNIEICGILMGLRRREALRRRDAILDFAELGARAELRLAELSTGQAGRLAVSTALHADLDIVLLDETLSVGDAAFQAKCEAAFAGLGGQGKTLLAASHDLELLRRLCRRTLRLSDGRGEVVEPAPAVLFIGNSLTCEEKGGNGDRRVLNDVPGLVSALGPGGVAVEKVVGDGKTLQDHWEDGRAVELIRSRSWDFVVLQEESTRPLADAEGMARSVRLFNDEIRKAGARPVLFMTWAQRGEQADQDLISRIYRDLGAELGAVVAAVGSAWAAAIEKRPGLDLHAADGRHAAPRGSYLASRVVAAVLFGHGGKGGAAARLGIPPGDVRFLDAVAEECSGR
jgi:ABC-type polysaccharide/polyol phosphate transport system ATPase subunit